MRRVAAVYLLESCSATLSDRLGGVLTNFVIVRHVGSATIDLDLGAVCVEDAATGGTGWSSL